MDFSTIIESFSGIIDTIAGLLVGTPLEGIVTTISGLISGIIGG